MSASLNGAIFAAVVFRPRLTMAPVQEEGRTPTPQRKPIFTDDHGLCVFCRPFRPWSYFWFVDPRRQPARSRCCDWIRVHWRSFVVETKPPHVGCYGLVLNSASIFRRTSSLIRINGGHGLLNPSPASLRVASIPSFEPIAISDVAWSKTSDGPLVKMLSCSQTPAKP